LAVTALVLMSGSDELPQAVTAKYKVDWKVGEGTYGVVYKAFHRETNEIVAIKKFKANSPKEGEGEGISLTAYREIMLLREIDQENCVKVSDIILHPAESLLFLVFDYAEFELYEVIKYHREKSQALPERCIRSYLWQMLNGVHYLHSHWILHRDLKPSNILIMGPGPEVGRVKIADFGLARIFKDPLKPLSDNGIVVTIWYRAPELLLASHHYSRPIDIWALGCIFAEFYLNKPLFADNKKHDVTSQINAIVKTLGKPTLENWPGMINMPAYSKITDIRENCSNVLRSTMRSMSDNAFDLLCKMLEYDPDKRITAEEALAHQFFKDGGFSLNAFDDLGSIPYPLRKRIPK